MADDPAPVDRRVLRRSALLLVLAGAIVQIALSAYYLSVGHSPHPRHLPVGLVAPASERGELTGQIDRGGSFRAREFADAAALTRAIRHKDVYGGVDVTGHRPHLYVASAAGATASNTIRTAFLTVVEQRRQQQLQELVAAGGSIPASRVAALAEPPQITDVVPLPKDDSTGGSLGLLVQALALGATVASLGLGRIGARTRRSLRRGLAHVLVLGVYAAVSAAAVSWSASWFGVIPGHAAGRLYLDFLLLSLAITASTAAVVALVGAVGALVGTLYFTLGVIISGSSILPEFLPTVGRVVGQSLPTGAGVTAIRESLYFPDASSSGPIILLALYAGVGLAIILASNAFANRTCETSVAAELATTDESR